MTPERERARLPSANLTVICPYCYHVIRVDQYRDYWHDNVYCCSCLLCCGVVRVLRVAVMEEIDHGADS